MVTVAVVWVFVKVTELGLKLRLLPISDNTTSLRGAAVTEMVACPDCPIVRCGKSTSNEAGIILTPKVPGISSSSAFRVYDGCEVVPSECMGRHDQVTATFRVPVLSVAPVFVGFMLLLLTLAQFLL